METRTETLSDQSASTLTTTRANSPSKAALWTGWIIGVLPCLMLFMSAAMKFSQNKQVLDGFDHLGWPHSSAIPLGIVELACTILYLIPQTAVLGAILLTGYMGGVIATNTRIGESFVIPLILGVVFWAGLFLRDPRIRRLIPFRR